LQILTTIAALRAAVAATRPSTLGLVPTMGALHEGHLSLVRAAQAQCDLVAVSIFVNPTQFAPNEDFSKYPRTFDQDCALLEQEGVDLLFAPTPDEMYPAGRTHTFVEVPGLTDRLDGASRPGHLRAVATVVSKLFHIVQPQFAYFGQKDAAQAATLRAMVRDLDLPLTMVVCPTVREPDGLALSSRNRYLSPEQRTDALGLIRALDTVVASAAEGVCDAHALKGALTQALKSAPGLAFDYAEVVHPDTLEPIADLSGGALVAVAAWAGTTRLIDNVVLPPMHPAAPLVTNEEVSA
jgi:pantoate--beta-alanine ligase